MQHKLLNLALLAGMSLAVNASAATFTDRASFDAAVTNMITLDFEGLVGTPAYPENYYTTYPYYPYSNGGTGHYQKSINVSGIDFSYIGESDYTYILENSVGCPSQCGIYSINESRFALLLSSTSDGFTRITMPSGINAFGADWGNGGPIEITIHFRNTLDTETLSLIAETKSNYFGYIGNEIHYIDWEKPTGGQYSILDNVSIAQAVPEPETYALMLAGLGLVGFVARRRKHQQASA